MFKGFHISTRIEYSDITRIPTLGHINVLHLYITNIWAASLESNAKDQNLRILHHYLLQVHMIDDLIRHNCPMPSFKHRADDITKGNTPYT